MIVIINEPFTMTMLEKLVPIFNSNPSHIDLYLDSVGGEIKAEYALISMVENATFPVNIYALELIQSAAFSFFFKVKTKGKKYLSKTCIGLMHSVRVSLDLNDKAQPYFQGDEVIYEKLKEYKKLNDELAKKLGLTEKEKKVLNRGEDLQFAPARLQEIFKYSHNGSKETETIIS